MSVKISIIGAGSGAFSLAMIRDLCLTRNLSGCTVSFMDINPTRLDAAYTLCKRYAEEMNFPMTLEKTLDRSETLDGADFVCALGDIVHAGASALETIRNHNF
jgi:alpha-galactosidase